MSTLVFLHAHPDDEAIATGGSMARATAEGHRVVLVCATRGEHGEVAEGLLGEGETLGERRSKELEASCKVLGVSRLAFLDYMDSGMIDTPENEAAESFWQADIEEAAHRMAAILTEESADVISIYDEHGNYGHPDHIQVHRVGKRAAEIAGTERVYMATMNRDFIRDLMARARELGIGDPPGGDEGPGEDFGEPHDRITTAVDVAPFIGHKRSSMAAHASQITDGSFFLSMPEEAFATAFGTEWYIRIDTAPGTMAETWLL